MNRVYLLTGLLSTPVWAAGDNAGSLSVDVLLLCLLVYAGKRLLKLCERLPNQPR